MAMPKPKLWMLHRQHVRRGRVSSLESMTLGDDTGAESDGSALLRRWTAEYGTVQDEAPHQDRETFERRLFDLGLDLLDAAETGNARRLADLMADGFPVNFQHPQTLETALHKAGARSHREVVRALIRSGACDYLIQDSDGRFPHHSAEFFGNDPTIERLLVKKARQQAGRDGVDLFRIQLALLERWANQDWFIALTGGEMHLTASPPQSTRTRARQKQSHKQSHPDS